LDQSPSDPLAFGNCGSGANGEPVSGTGVVYNKLE